MTESQPTSASAYVAPPVSADALLRAREYGTALSAVVRGLPLGTVAATPDGRVAFANASFASLLGYDDADAIVGRNVFDLTHPDDRPLDQTLAMEVLAGLREGYSVEKRFVHRDGSAVWASASATLVRGPTGAPDFAFGIVQDIGARKRVEAAAAEARERAEAGRRVLEAIMRYAPEGITVADAPDVRIRLVSTYGATLTGKAATELEAIPADAHPEVWDIYHADGITRARPEELPLTRATVAGEVVKDEEWVLGRPDGSRTTILCNAGPIRDDADRITGGVIVWRDIDERKRAAEERDRLLESERAARRDAEVASRVRGEFLASMSHELRTPLNAILGYQDLLETGAAGALTELQRQYVERVRGSARHLLSLINQILSFSRIEAGAMEYALAPVPVRRLIHAAVPLVEPQAAAKAVAVVVPPLPAELTGVADAEKATQVLLNLLGNAVKFTPPGGRIDVSTSADGDRIAIRVRDTGPGIPADQVDDIFQPFRQGAIGGGQRPEGTGLGLSIARALARGMGGDVLVESSSGQGSTFVLLLPVSVPA
ncbi:MAG TPA: PAS domain-containing sensor histidine kinase [Gemmatimonadaceae bacterium]|nr:PAS domain-containing sensor histidine kinase [Gemmatimonadaceae bacterium]